VPGEQRNVLHLERHVILETRVAVVASAQLVTSAPVRVNKLDRAAYSIAS
jgi:hypothetical protein